MLAEIIAIAAIVLMIGGAVAYIIKAKKSGKKCIGCPYASSCKSGGCSSCKSIGEEEEKQGNAARHSGEEER